MNHLAFRPRSIISMTESNMVTDDVGGLTRKQGIEGDNPNR